MGNTNGTIQVFELPSFRIIYQFNGHRQTVNRICWCDNGMYYEFVERITFHNNLPGFVTQFPRHQTLKVLYWPQELMMGRLLSMIYLIWINYTQQVSRVDGLFLAHYYVQKH